MMYNSLKMNNFYVYLHVHHDTGYPVIFYVGKGQKDRAWSMKDRNRMWHNVSSKHGWSVVIHSLNLAETEAFELETKLIDAIGRRDTKNGPLVNLARGGKGGDRGPSANAKSAEGQRKSWAEKREMRIESLKGSWTDERKSKQDFSNARKGSSESAKTAWSDPIERNRRIEAMKLSHAKRRESGQPRYSKQTKQA